MVIRHTRRMALTGQGAAYLVCSRRMLAEFDEMERGFDVRDGTAPGLIRMTATVEFCQRFLAPLVNVFL